MHTIYIYVLILWQCLQHLSNIQVFILRKTCTCNFMVFLSYIHISCPVDGMISLILDTWSRNLVNEEAWPTGGLLRQKKCLNVQHRVHQIGRIRPGDKHWNTLKATFFLWSCVKEKDDAVSPIHVSSHCNWLHHFSELFWVPKTNLQKRSSHDKICNFGLR
jgi:hypothetical protein